MLYLFSLSKTTHLFSLNLMNDFVSTVSSHCNGNPCQNEGKCVDTGDNFRCDCQNGFTGAICQIGKTRFIDYLFFFILVCRIILLPCFSKLVVFSVLFFCASANSRTTRGKTNSLGANQSFWIEELVPASFSLSKDAIVLLMNTCCPFH